MKKVAFHSLGCKVNSYETDAMIRLFEQAGYEVVPFTETADVYVVNTCTVTNIADRKSRQMLHRAKQCNPQGVVVAAGCYVQADSERAAADPHVDLIIGNDQKAHVVELVEAHQKYAKKAAFANRQIAPAGQDDGEALHTNGLVLDINHKKDYEELTVETTAEHTRACLKIQDGCNQFCSYCLIPYVRGRVRSRKLANIVEEARTLAANGFRELVLTGIHLSTYGIDFLPEETATLLDVIRALHKIEGVERIRLGSLEPRIITEEFVQQLAKLPKVCPHFHLSLQSGCDSVLKRMNRHYTTAQYADACRLLRTYYTDPAITTDVIVGFPQETEEEFAVTKQFLTEVSLYEMHIFKYSRRKGTVADRMPGQLTDAKKTARSHELQTISAKCSQAFREKWIGRTVEVLFEEPVEMDGIRYYVGHSREYVRVLVQTEQNLQNVLADVQILDADERGFVVARSARL